MQWRSPAKYSIAIIYGYLSFCQTCTCNQRSTILGDKDVSCLKRDNRVTMEMIWVHIGIVDVLVGTPAHWSSLDFGPAGANNFPFRLASSSMGHKGPNYG